MKVTRAHEEIDFGQFFLKGPPITLREAPRDHKRVAAAFLLVRSVGENGVDGLLRGILDKTTSVDDDDVG